MASTTTKTTETRFEIVKLEERIAPGMTLNHIETMVSDIRFEFATK